MYPTVCTIDGCEKPAGRVRYTCYMHYTRIQRTGDAGGARRTTVAADAPLAERMAHSGWDVTPTGCWEWRGQRVHRGYGKVSIGENRQTYAHRAAWSLANGPIPRGMLIRHTCDNPPCVNPDHLLLGTHRDNMRDMVERERNQRGERHAFAVLTDAQVAEIRTAVASGRLQKDVAEEYGINRAYVSELGEPKEAPLRGLADLLAVLVPRLEVHDHGPRHTATLHVPLVEPRLVTLLVHVRDGPHQQRVRERNPSHQQERQPTREQVVTPRPPHPSQDGGARDSDPVPRSTNSAHN
jgi:hypothetical protein